MEKRTGLFLWIPRTGGTSIWSVLEGPQRGHHSQRCRNRPFDPAKTLTTFQHTGIGSLLDDGTIAPEWLGQQWTFAFVRHPAARLVSVYHHLRQGRADQRQHVAGMDFRQFAERACDGDIPPVGRESAIGIGYANRQTDWLWLEVDGGKRQWLPDYVGRMEDLPNSFGPVQETLGIRGVPPRTNTSRHDGWRTYYDGPLLDKVRRRYAEEIDLFGYTA